MPFLTFYGGVNEIGGNKILFEAEGTRIFLDFGMSFNIANQYFAEFLQPRKCTALADFFELGFLPDTKAFTEKITSRTWDGGKRRGASMLFCLPMHMRTMHSISTS